VSKQTRAFIKQVWRKVAEFYRSVSDKPAFRTKYDFDGSMTGLMSYNVCRDYAKIFGGSVIYCPEEYRKLRGRRKRSYR